MKNLKLILLIGFLSLLCGCTQELSNSIQRQKVVQFFDTANVVSNPECKNQYFVKDFGGHIWLANFDGNGKMQITQIF